MTRDHALPPLSLLSIFYISFRIFRPPLRWAISCINPRSLPRGEVIKIKKFTAQLRDSSATGLLLATGVATGPASWPRGLVGSLPGPGCIVKSMGSEPEGEGFESFPSVAVQP